MFTPEYNKFFQLGARNFHFSKYKRVFQNSKSSLLKLFILRARKIYFLKYKKHFFLRKCQKFFLEFPFFFSFFYFLGMGLKVTQLTPKSTTFFKYIIVAVLIEHIFKHLQYIAVCYLHYTLFYKQHFYKHKLAKIKQATPWG